MKKICMLFNALVDSNGVSRSAVAIANLLSERKDVEVTLIPLYLCSSDTLARLNDRVKVKKLFGFYLKGFSHFANLLPKKFYARVLGLKKYDVQIAFQYGLSTRIIAAASRRSHAYKYAWMHCYDEGVALRREYERIGHVVCVSKENAERLRADVSDIKVDYNYNPIDDKMVRCSGEEPIDLQRTAEPLFIFVGRHSKEKGLMRLLGIVKRLITEGYRFRLWLVGDGPQHEELMRRTTELELDEVVTFTGAKGNPHAYTSKADVFVCSSFVEGYSTACTEAIMLDVPVITTCVSGGREIIDEAQCGLLTGMDDESLYQGIKQVLDNPALIAQWKETLKTTREAFSQKVRAEHLFQLLGV